MSIRQANQYFPKQPVALLLFYATLLDVGLTEFSKISTPHLTPVILLGGCAVLLPALTVLAASMEALGQMPEVRWHDGFKVVGLVGVAAISGLQNFMNQTYGRYREDKQKHETEAIERIARTKGHDEEGHLR